MNRLVRRTIIPLTAMLFLWGCETTKLEIREHTLAGNPRIPHKVIRDFYEGTQWNQVKDIPYDAYVIFRASIEDDRSLQIREVVDTYPDASYEKRARIYAREIRISPVTIGTRVPPVAEVCVVFYETGFSPNKALVFARQKGVAASSNAHVGTRYFVWWTYFN